MDDLLLGALAWSPATLLPVLLWAVARTASAQARRWLVWILCLGALGALVLAGTVFGDTATQEVLNPFFDPRVLKPVPFVVDQTSVPAWQAPLCLSIFWAAGAGWIARRQATAAPPCPVTFVCLVTGWTLILRLVLERSAAPQALAWSVGVTMPTLVLLPFVGAWAGRRGDGFGKLIWMGFLIGLVQRGLLVAVGWLCTIWGLGTHLDVGAIESVHLLVGERDFGSSGDRRLEQWWTLIAVPQLVLWIPLTVASSALLGFWPWRRAGAGGEGSSTVVAG